MNDFSTARRQWNLAQVTHIRLEHIMNDSEISRNRTYYRLSRVVSENSESFRISRSQSSELRMYDRVLKINKINEICSKYRKVIIQDRITFRKIKLNEYYEKEKVLYRDEKL